MKPNRPTLVTARLLLPALAVGALSIAGCGGGSSTSTTAKFFQTNLVADTAGHATVTDPNLVNAWGIAFSPGGPFWISDNGTGDVTLYDGSGNIQSLVVKVPAAGGGVGPAPVTGQIYNGTSGFIIPANGPAQFIFDSEDGVISAWYQGTNAVAVNDRSATGAVYKGLTMGSNGGVNFLYATNFNSGKVDVFDTNFALVNSFTDATVPAGYAPFGIQNINGLLYVTFALQNGAKHDDVAGPGNGFVDVFNPSGTLKMRLVSNGALNSPWGVALAPSSFGKFGGALLIGNFGDGHINAYNITTGASLGSVNNAAGTPIVIDGLWAIVFGGGGTGTAGTLYFTSGPNGESNGLFGSIAPGP